jgi:hypothetical protein
MSRDVEIITPRVDYRAQVRRDMQEMIVTLLKEGVTRSSAAKAAGIDRVTLYRWMQSDATFATQVERAEAESIAFIEANLYRNIKAFTGDPKVMLKWLERRSRDEWGEKLTIDLSTLTDEQIIRLLERTNREGRVTAEDYHDALAEG